ncbi:unnamed protein product [Cladocopium goreaui]|uniref:Uncharacterized protein n=1 Tax=Cladocopium goreaui TaxID=2562237 RepID=A0A9P1C566_9DINO|nr:unnamed protein product [Cladocopium goreaui]
MSLRSLHRRAPGTTGSAAAWQPPAANVWRAATATSLMVRMSSGSAPTFTRRSYATSLPAAIAEKVTVAAMPTDGKSYEIRSLRNLPHHLFFRHLQVCLRVTRVRASRLDAVLDADAQTGTVPLPLLPVTPKKVVRARSTQSTPLPLSPPSSPMKVSMSGDVAGSLCPGLSKGRKTSESSRLDLHPTYSTFQATLAASQQALVKELMRRRDFGNAGLSTKHQHLSSVFGTCTSTKTWIL